jgi:hypothetical protein
MLRLRASDPEKSWRHDDSTPWGTPLLLLGDAADLRA